MNQLLFRLLACPSCRSDKLVKVEPGVKSHEAEPPRCNVGLISCSSCDRWYPIEDGIVCMLPDSLRVRARDEAFIEEHGDTLGVETIERLKELVRSWDYSDSAIKLFDDFEVPIIRKDRTKYVNHRLKFEAILQGVKGSGNGPYLELACGNGTHAALLLEEYPDISYVGIDISHMRLRETQERIEKYGNVLLVQASLEALPFREASFSAIYAASVLQYLKRPQEGMKEAQRVLKENGSFTTLDYNPKCYASILGLAESHHKGDKLIDEHMYERMTRENIKKWMKEAVFSDTKIENFLYLPGILPIALYASRAINNLIKRIPFINEFSIMLLTTAKKHEDIDH